MFGRGWGAVCDTAFIAGRRVNVAATSNSRRQESDIRRHINKFIPLGDLLHCWTGGMGAVVGSDVLECAVGLHCSGTVTYRLGGPHGTICPRTEREPGETCRSQPIELLSITAAVLCTCARVQVCFCGGDIRHFTGLPNRSVGEILN